jgi:hypothetical protein
MHDTEFPMWKGERTDSISEELEMPDLTSENSGFNLEFCGYFRISIPDITTVDSGGCVEWTNDGVVMAQIAPVGDVETEASSGGVTIGNTTIDGWAWSDLSFNPEVLMNGVELALDQDLNEMTGTIAIYAVSFWIPTIVQNLGIPPGAYFRIGLLSMIPWTAMIIVQVLWARHSDRTAERRWHSSAGNFMAAAGLAMLAAWPLNPILALTGLSLVTAGCGCSVVTFWPMPQSLFAGAAAAAGIALINSMGALGGYIGPMLIGQIRAANQGDATFAFIALAVIAALGGVLVLVASAGRDEHEDASAG